MTEPALLEQLLRACRDGIASFDQSLVCRFWSPFLAELTGLSPAHAVGRSMTSLLPFLDGDEHLLLEAVTGTSHVLEGRAYAFENRRGYCRAWITPLKGASRGGILMLQDATAEREALRHSEESERRFRLMADSSPVLLWMSGTDTLCTYFNQSWLDFTGRTMEQELGVGWAEGVHPEDLQRCLDTYLDAFNRRESFEMEYRLRRRDGAFCWILDRGVPRHTAEGAFSGYIGSCVDIQKLKEVQHELRRSVHLRDDFLSIASHELKTPLNTLRLEVQGLRRVIEKHGEVPHREDLVETIAAIEEASTRMEALVLNLLDVSRIAAGRLEIERRPINLSRLITSVVDRFRPLMSEKGIDVTLDVPPGVEGSWDAFRIDQVLTNLLSNAIQYGLGKPIQVALRPTPNAIRLEVRDEGIGIDPAFMPRLFEPFERSETSLRHPAGMGLGLNIARQIVRAHGGTIEVASTHGKGSLFTVVLARQ